MAQIDIVRFLLKKRSSGDDSFIPASQIKKALSHVSGNGIYKQLIQLTFYGVLECRTKKPKWRGLRDGLDWNRSYRLFSDKIKKAEAWCRK